MTVQMSLVIDISNASSASFKTSFANTIATSLGIEAARVQITAVKAGSAIVSINILPPVSGSAVTVSAAAVAANILAMSVNPSSPLVANVQSSLGVAVNTNYAPPTPVSTQLCSDGVYRATCPTSTSTATTAPTAAVTVRPTSAASSGGSSSTTTTTTTSSSSSSAASSTSSSSDTPFMVIGAIIVGVIVVGVIAFVFFVKTTSAASAVAGAEMSSIATKV
jgi:hypothetical protein